MSLLCKVFGHSFRKSYYAHEGLRLEIRSPMHDGMGSSHRYINADCARCNMWIRIGKVIDPDTKKRT